MASIQARPPFNHHGPPPQTGPYLPNGQVNLPPPGPFPGAAGLPPQKIIEKSGARILCVADVRGHLRTLNDLAKTAKADYIIHTGDFGFYDANSMERIAEKTLRHVAQYSPLLTDQQRKMISAQNPPNISTKQRLESMSSPNQPFVLSELQSFIEKKHVLDVPVYTVWGACEDVHVIEKFRSGEYQIPNLHIIDEVNSRLLDVGGVKLRLLGLGGAIVMHKLFDNGEGRTTIAGGQGTMWATLLQMGELVDTANRVYDGSETRIFVTHTSPAREGLLNQLSVTLKADFSISAGLHFRYGSSYNEFSVNPSIDHYRGKLSLSKASFNDVWETVKGEVLPAVASNQHQQTMLDNALNIIEKMPSSANGGNPFGPPTGPQQSQVDEAAFKNMWNFNLADAAFGYLVLETENGKIGTEMRAQGFNFSHRTGKQPHSATQQNNASSGPSQTTSSVAPTNIPSGPAGGINKPGVVTPAVPYNQPVPMRNQTPSHPTSLQQSQQQQGSTINANAPIEPSPKPAAAQPVKPATPLGSTQAPPAVPLTEKPPPAQSSNGTPAPQAPSEPAKSPSPAGSPTAATAPESEQAGASRYPRLLQQPGLYVSGVDTADEARKVVPSDDEKLITGVQEKTSQNNKKYFYVYFETKDIANEVFERVPSDLKTAEKGKPLVKVIDYDEMRYKNSGVGGARWGRGGYDSRGDRGKSSASESEGGPGGSFRGGRSGYRGGNRSHAGPSNRGGFDQRRASGRGGRGGFGGGGSLRGGRGGAGEGSAPQTPVE